MPSSDAVLFGLAGAGKQLRGRHARLAAQAGHGQLRRDRARRAAFHCEEHRIDAAVCEALARFARNTARCVGHADRLDDRAAALR